MNELEHPPSEPPMSAAEVTRRLTTDPSGLTPERHAALREPPYPVESPGPEARWHEAEAHRLLTGSHSLEMWDFSVAQAQAHATLALSLRKRDELELAFGFGRYGS